MGIKSITSTGATPAAVAAACGSMTAAEKAQVMYLLDRPDLPDKSEMLLLCAWVLAGHVNASGGGTMFGYYMEAADTPPVDDSSNILPLPSGLQSFVVLGGGSNFSQLPMPGRYTSQYHVANTSNTCPVSSSDVDAVLVAIDSNWASAPATLNQVNLTACVAPGEAGIIAAASLVTKGFTVSYTAPE